MRDISKLKALLDISAEDESRDELLSFLLDSAERYALSYCRLPALGDELECVAVEMAGARITARSAVREYPRAACPEYRSITVRITAKRSRQFSDVRASRG